MSRNVDALLVINNERLRTIYGELSMMEAFAKADDTLSVAAKSIAEIITVHGQINLDFNDVKTVLKDGGVAIMSTGYGEGDGRVKKAIADALNSPLLNDNDVFNSKKILISISFRSDDAGHKGLMMDEMNDVHDFMDKFGSDFELKWGVANDPSLGEKVKVTILATGFGLSDIDAEMAERMKKYQTAEDLQKLAEERDREQKLQDNFNRYYGGDGNSTVKKRNYHIYYFSPSDLDNEDLILAVENQPTYTRTRQQLENLANLVKPQQRVADTTSEKQPAQAPTADAAQSNATQQMLNFM